MTAADLEGDRRRGDQVRRPVRALDARHPLGAAEPSAVVASAGAGVLRRATAVIRGYVDLQTSHSSRSRRPKGRLHLPWAQTSRATGTRNTGGAFASLVRANVPRPLGGASSGAFAGQVSAGRPSMRRQRSRHPADVASRRRRATGELVGPRASAFAGRGHPRPSATRPTARPSMPGQDAGASPRARELPNRGRAHLRRRH
jgi:hypothetical protein